MANKPKLTAYQIRYCQRAKRIRTKLSIKAMARRFGVSPCTIAKATMGIVSSKEEHEDRLSTDARAIYKRNWRRQQRIKNERGFW